jgi:hypothetical protein
MRDNSANLRVLSYIMGKLLHGLAIANNGDLVAEAFCEKRVCQPSPGNQKPNAEQSGDEKVAFWRDADRVGE